MFSVLILSVYTNICVLGAMLTKIIQTLLSSTCLPDVPNQLNQLVAEEICCQFRHMTQDRTDPKKGGGAIQIFQVLIQKGEHKAISKAHEPSDEQDRAILDTA